MLKDLRRDVYDSIIHLFYPSICFGCENEIIERDEMLCLSCIQSLPYTYFEKTANNPVSKLFWGRCTIKAGLSTFYFIEKTPLQNIIHQIKYKNERALGLYMGSLMGHAINEVKKNIPIDLCIPMPLHPKKERMRGYNQSELLARGIEKATGIPIATNILNRTEHTSSQTKKNRMERWLNVETAFHISNPNGIKGKNILLIDDVITTGASIEACVHVLLAKDAAGVIVVSLAYTL